MAIKIQGTTVIDDSRNATNLGDITASGDVNFTGSGSFKVPSGTTAQRPASPSVGEIRYNTDNSEFEQYDGAEWSGIGGGAAGAELVASGSIPGAGTSVALLSDGTVEIVEGNFVSEEVGTISTWSSSVKNLSSAYDSGAGKVVIAYRDKDTFQGKAVVGTVSGSSISFGSDITFESGAADYIRARYDSTTGKVVIAYKDNSTGNGKAIVGTVSGNSISFGSDTTFTGDSAYYAATFADDKFVIAYQDDAAGGDGAVIVGTVSGDSISFGSDSTFTTNTADPQDMTYDPTAGKIVIVYQDDSTGNGKVIVGTVSGDSVSFGNEANLISGNLGDASLVYEPVAEKVVAAYRDTDGDTKAAVGTVSGDSITFGIPITFNSVGRVDSGVYDSAAGKIVFSYTNGSQGDRGELVVGTVSGDSISFDSPVIYSSNVSAGISSIYDSAAEKVVISWYDENSNGDAITYNPAYTGTNADDFIGFAQDSAADTDTVLVATNQQIDANQTGLTPKSTYYVDTDGTLTTLDTGLPVAGFALDSNTLRVGG